MKEQDIKKNSKPDKPTELSENKDDVKASGNETSCQNEMLEDEVELEDEIKLNNDEDDESVDDLMEPSEQKESAPKKLTLMVIVSIIMKNWWVFVLNCALIGGIAALLIVEDPRTYTAVVKLAPETESSSTGGLSSIASSFGIDLTNMTSTDAIRPDLYPDLVQSNDFIYALFKLPVKSMDGNIHTDYYTYLKKYQKSSWWRKDLNTLKEKLFGKPEEAQLPANIKQQEGLDRQTPRFLTGEEERMMERIQGLISCDIDQKTYVITITVKDQDPLIAASVADSVSTRIQKFITDYRTKKAIKDYEYYHQLLIQAEKEYQKSCSAYANYVDSHRDVILQSYISERDQLENDMQLKLDTYNAMIAQAQQAKAKVQETTPAFTVMQNAFVPVKPSGPKRMLFVLGMVFLTFIMTLFMMLRKILTENLKA